MAKIILLKDRNNFFSDDIFGKLEKLSGIDSWTYEEFFNKTKKELSGGVFYLTPMSDTRLIDSIKSFIKSDKIKTVNPLHLQLADKPTIDNIFLKLDIPHPKGILTNDCLTAQEFIKKHRMVIIKSVNDCGGSGHFIVRGNSAYWGNKKYFLNWQNDKTSKREILKGNLLLSPPFYIQEFLYPDNNSVWRAYIIGREVKFFSIRKRRVCKNLGDYVINVAKGAQYFFEERDNFALKLMCQKFSEVVNLEVGAIDIIFHKNKPYFLEVNCEGIWVSICRKFYECPDYNFQKHNLDWFIAEYLKKL